jgi:class 3 adenylate cyclase/pimeloyl-ACP methyl ester carboxylesterase
MENLPTGTVTFLFTDIEGSTHLWEHYPTAMRDSLVLHHEILHASIAARGGHVFNIVGDAFCVAFAGASDAVLAAVAAQRALLVAAWGETGSLHVRMALHTGNAEVVQGDYVSNRALNRISRVLSTVHGRQIVMTLASEELVRDFLPTDISLADLGEHKLRDLIYPEHLFQVMAPDLPNEFPPLKATPTKVIPAQDLTAGPTPTGDRLRGRQLVGRADAMLRLERRLEGLKQAEGGVVLVSGEPGIGKTRLIDEVIRQARTRGFQILVGRCHERDISIPYLPMSEALELYARDCAPATWERLLRIAGPEIYLLLSDTMMKSIVSLYGAGAPASPEAAESLAARLNTRPWRAVRNLLYEMARTTPVIWVIDDLHWSDPSSLDLIHEMALHIRELPILILGTYREIELERTHPLNEMLQELNRARVLDRVRLRRFALLDTERCLAELMGGQLPAGFGALVHGQTEGNPFFIEELMNSLIDDARLVWNEQERSYRFATGVTVEELTNQVPEGVRATIGNRLTRLDHVTQHALGLASVIGRYFSLDALLSLAAVNGLSDEAVRQSIMKARAARFVSVRERLGEQAPEIAGFAADAADLEADIAFDHALIHQVIYDELNLAERRRLHADTGRLFEEIYAGHEGLYAERIAYHFLASDDELKAVQYSLIAGDKMYRAYYNPDLALGYYLPALELMLRKEPSVRHLLVRSPLRGKRGARHQFTPGERETIVSYVSEVLQAFPHNAATKALALLANRICVVTMHTGETFSTSVRLYEQALLGPDVQKMVVPTSPGNLVGILEFPGPGGPYPVVMMLHGNPGSKESIASECKRYLSRGLATLRVDLPGHGETTVPATLGSADGAILKEMVTAVLGHERVDSRGIAVEGWSYGPWAAIHLGAVDPRVRAIASISGIFDHRDDEVPPRESRRPWWLARWKAGMWPSPDPFFDYPQDSPAFTVADQIHCPTLFVYGGLEENNYIEQNDKMTSMIASAVKRVYPNGMHVLVNIPEALEGVAEWVKQQLAFFNASR